MFGLRSVEELCVIERQDADPEPISIVCVIHSLDGGGAERVMAGLASRLARRGHRVKLLTFDNARNDRHPLDDDVDRVALNLAGSATGLLSKLFRVRRRHRALRRAINAATADVVISFCDRNNVDVLLSLHRRSPPVIVCERSDPAQQSLGRIWNSLRRHTYPRASAVVSLTETSAKYLRGFSDDVVVIPSSVDVPPMVSNRVEAMRNSRIVAVGRLEHEKGFDRLLQAFAIATKDQPQWNMMICGEGSQRSALIELSHQLGIADRLDLPGWVRPIWKPLSEATMFCLPSRYEGFPSALLEAMAVGVPAISVDCESGPRAIVRTGENGLLVDPNVEGLAEGIVRWIRDPEERERHGRAGVSVINEFGWDTMVDAYESLIRNVIASRQSLRKR